MTRKAYIFVLCFICAIASAMAQTSVDISVPRRANAGTPFSITIEVTNPDGAITTPRLPELQGCRLLMQNPSVSTSHQTYIFNGNRQSIQMKSFTYTLIADEETTVKVPSVTVNIGGKEFSTQPKQFNVNAASANSGRQPNPSPFPDPDDFFGGFPGGEPDYPDQSQQQNPGNKNQFQTDPNDLFMKIAVSSSQVYEQQPVRCEIKVYSTAQNIEQIAAKGLPAFDGCLIEPLEQGQNIQWMEETVNGRPMYSAVIYRALLYPQRPGEIELKGVDYDLTIYREVIVQDFMFNRVYPERKQIVLRPRDAKITVKALPEPRPANFSGAVGNFSASAELIGRSFKTNEASTVEYKFTGTGNIKFFTAPQIDFPSEFEVYEPNVTTQARVSGSNMSGTQTVEYTFVPQYVGDFRIGDLDFVYFNPATGQYETQKVQGFDINVAQGATVSSSTSTGTNKRDIEAKNTDILHIKMGADKQGSKPVYIAQMPVYWVAYPLVLAIFVIVLIVYGKTRNANPDGRRIKGAGKVARKSLSKAGKFLQAQQYDQYYEELLRAMQNYLSNKLSIPASQFSRERVIDSLQHLGAADDLRKQVVTILDDCEMARYSPQSSGAAETIFNSARNVINEIEHLKA